MVQASCSDSSILAKSQCNILITYFNIRQQNIQKSETRKQVRLTAPFRLIHFKPLVRVLIKTLIYK